MAAATALGVGLSPIWYNVMFSPSFVTNALATLFAAVSLLTLDPRRGVPTGWRLVTCVVSMVLAVLSHETALVLPFVAVSLLLGIAPQKPTFKQVAPFGVPVAVFLLTRLFVGMPDGGGYYSTVELPLLVERLQYFLPGALLPYNDVHFRFPQGGRSHVATLALMSALAANAVGLVAMVAGFRARPRRRVIALSIALAFATFPGYWMWGDPRFMGIGLLTSLAIILYLTTLMTRLRVTVVALFIVSQALLFTNMMERLPGKVDFLVSAGRFYDYVSGTIDEVEPDAVVLVNDYYGQHGALAMLALASADSDPKPRMVVLNGLSGDLGVGAKTSVVHGNGAVVIENRLTETQQTVFHGGTPDVDTPNGGFTYGPLEGADETASFVARAPLDGERLLIVGMDPATGECLPPFVCDSP